MNQLTTYKAKSKNSTFELLFKYDLNGYLKEFKIEVGELSPTQSKWLFSPNFPADENIMKQIWLKDPGIKKAFIIEKSPADLSFESFWNLWNLKVKRETSEKAWNKLSETDKIKSFLNHKKYQEHLQKTGQAKAHLVTWLNQKRYNDEF